MQSAEIWEWQEKFDSKKKNELIIFQVLRWGRPIGIIRNVFLMLKGLSKKDGKTDAQGLTFTYFKTLADISLALFFLFDHVLYLGRVLWFWDVRLIF